MTKNTKKRLIVSGADHAMSHCVDTAGYENEAKEVSHTFGYETSFCFYGLFA